ncbi:glycosyl transferase family 2 [Thioalkalivibrio sp. XN8]|uniref:glycosyl transferase family 2 n=1 Tax=Thioalkalivibrio sp. XN8 TaxID=2712863 RepID=UPI0013EC93F0|nr:glycosyl transferase family 2 [Thioalkalivibrio sp. XN8]NGP52995.1 glycosyl transferase family 2 [Thioalkalivibrio sp. XN8]
MAPALTLSVIVPVGPGDRAWPGLLQDLGGLDETAEIILVAATGEAPADFSARAHGLRAPARWLEAPAGRARQQNAGARAARGPALWFLHADSRLPPRTVAAALDFAGRAGLGYFRLRYLADGPWPARLNACGAGLRSRLLGLPFGDQGFLLRRATFEALGGFDEGLAGGEDHALVWMARAGGVPLVDLAAPIHSSARRYGEQGWLRTTVRHARLTISQARRFRALARRRTAER